MRERSTRPSRTTRFGWRLGGATWLLALAGVIGAASIVVAAPAAASDVVVPGIQLVTNGDVRSIVPAADGTVYFGGSFSLVGPRTGGGVILDPATGAPQGSWPEVNGTVRAAVPDGSGGWYLGGEFDSVGDQWRSNLAHVGFDGSVDLAWDPGADGAVFALRLDGSTLYVGGSFTSIGALDRKRLAAVDASSGVVRAWNPGADETVRALDVQAGIVYAGGYFTQVGGTTRRHLAAIDGGTAAVQPWNPDPDGVAFAIAATPDAVYVGGRFVSAGGQSHGPLTALDPASGAATGWNPACRGEVYALAVRNGTVYAAGEISGIGGATRHLVAAVDARTGKATAWAPEAAGWMAIANRPPAVYSIAVDSSHVYIGGAFTTVNGRAVDGFAALDARTGEATSWALHGDGETDVVATGSRQVFVGGRFATLLGERRHGAAALDGGTGVLTPWDPDVLAADSGNAWVNAIALDGATVFLGGHFDSVGGQARQNLAAVDASTGTPTAWRPGVDWDVPSWPWVNALLASDSTLYVGGRFTSLGGAPRVGAGAFDLATGELTGWDPGVSGAVNSFLADGDTIYISGLFYSVGGAQRQDLATVDAHTAKLNGPATLWSGSEAGAMTKIGDDVYVATDAGLSRLHVGDPFGGLLLETPRPGAVHALASDGPILYVGGAFETIESQPSGSQRPLGLLGAFDTKAVHLTDWDAGFDFVFGSSRVGAVAVADGIVYAGGTFRTLNGLVQPGLVQLVPSPRYVAPPPDPAPTQPPATAATVPAVPSVPERKRAPRAIDSPGVLGAVRIGQRLTCFVGNWSANPPVTRYTVQWLRNGRPIGGAEGLTYQLTPSDAGTELNCEVTADNRVGIVSATGIGVRVPAFVSVARFTGRRISLTRGRVARVRVFCAAQPGHACAGRLALTTRRLATIPRSSSPLLLGSASFRLEAHKSKVVSVRIGRRAALPARRNGVRAFVIVEQAISAGAPPRSDVATALLELPARRRGPQTGRR